MGQSLYSVFFSPEGNNLCDSWTFDKHNTISKKTGWSISIQLCTPGKYILFINRSLESEISVLTHLDHSWLLTHFPRNGSPVRTCTARDFVRFSYHSAISMSLRFGRNEISALPPKHTSLSIAAKARNLLRNNYKQFRNFVITQKHVTAMSMYT
jgi:hypothetical protein